MASEEQRRNVNRLFLFIIIGYAIVVITYFVFRNKLEDFLCSHFSQDFAIGFSSAFFENLAFYLFGLPIAYFSIYLAFPDPKNESLETKIRALANGENITVTNDLYEHLRKTVSKSLAFNRQMLIRIEIRDFDVTKNFFLIYTDITTIITNMCRDNDYESTEGNAYIETDCVGGNGDYGEILYLGSYNPANKHERSDLINGEKLVAAKFEKRIRLNIPQNEEKGWIFKYVIWNSKGNAKNKTNLNEWIFVTSARYAPDIQISIVNKLSSNVPLNFDLRISRLSEEIVPLGSPNRVLVPLVDKGDLTFDSEVDIIKKIQQNIVLYPQDRLEFLIY